MTEIITAVADLGDSVFIRGIDLSQPFKPMTNNELTIEELKGIAGGLNPGDCVSALTSQVGSCFGMKEADFEKANKSGFSFAEGDVLR